MYQEIHCHAGSLYADSFAVSTSYAGVVGAAPAEHDDERGGADLQEIPPSLGLMLG